MAGQTTGTYGEGQKQVWTTLLTETATFDKEGVGALRWHGNKCYKWVKFNNGQGNVAAVAGNFCYYYLDSGLTNQEVTMDLTDGLLGAGVFQSVPADGEYCWIQVRGVATLTTALTGGADGNALTLVGTTDGTLDVSALVTDHICAYAIDASAKIVSLECPF